MISLVVPAYNEEKIIGQTLAALAKLRSPEPLEILLVDNRSTDRTVEIARSWEGKLPLRIISEEQKSRGAARAKGFAQSQGRIIFSTDADTQPPPDWIEKMLAPFVASDVVAAVGLPRIEDAGRVTNWFYNHLGQSFFWLQRLTTGSNPIVGFSFAVRREAYEQSGGFNPKLLAEEDVDLGQRLAKLGRIALVADVKVLTSGRRWQKGILAGVWPYAITTYHRLRKKEGFDLTDVR